MTVVLNFMTASRKLSNNCFVWHRHGFLSTFCQRQELVKIWWQGPEVLSNKGSGTAIAACWYYVGILSKSNLFGIFPWHKWCLHVFPSFLIEISIVHCITAIISFCCGHCPSLISKLGKHSGEWFHFKWVRNAPILFLLISFHYPADASYLVSLLNTYALQLNLNKLVSAHFLSLEEGMMATNMWNQNWKHCHWHHHCPQEPTQFQFVDLPQTSYVIRRPIKLFALFTAETPEGSMVRIDQAIYWSKLSF